MHVFSDDAAQGSFNDNEMNSRASAKDVIQPDIHIEIEDDSGQINWND